MKRKCELCGNEFTCNEICLLGPGFKTIEEGRQNANYYMQKKLVGHRENYRDYCAVCWSLR